MGRITQAREVPTCTSVVLRRGTLLLALSIAGCASSPVDSDSDYPVSFARLASPSGACPAIGAPISNQGVRYSPANGLLEPVVLTRDVLLLPDHFSHVDALGLTFDEASVPGLFSPIKVNVLHLVAGPGMDLRTPPEKSVCQGGVFHYILQDAGGFNPVGFALSSDSILFLAAVDGSLIVRRAHQEAGLVFVVPYKFRSSSIYYRFPVALGKAPQLP